MFTHARYLTKRGGLVTVGCAPQSLSLVWHLTSDGTTTADTPSSSAATAARAGGRRRSA